VDECNQLNDEIALLPDLSSPFIPLEIKQKYTILTTNLLQKEGQLKLIDFLLINYQ